METLVIQFEELENIKQRVDEENEIDIVKTTLLTNEERTITYCEIKKTIYVAKKEFYKQKSLKRMQKA